MREQQLKRITEVTNTTTDANGDFKTGFLLVYEANRETNELTLYHNGEMLQLTVEDMPRATFFLFEKGDFVELTYKKGKLYIHIL